MNIKPALIQVRFSDVDVMGHVNNAVYLSYFETARMHYFNQLIGEDWDWVKNGIILLKNEVQYIKPVLMNDSPVITISVDHIGNKSFTLGYNLKVSGESKCIGASTLVAFDNSKQKTISIPDVMRSKLETLKSEQ